MTTPTKDLDNNKNWATSNEGTTILDDLHKMIKELGGLENPFISNAYTAAVSDPHDTNFALFAKPSIEVFVTPHVYDCLQHPLPFPTQMLKWTWWERLKWRWRCRFGKKLKGSKLFDQK
jgi:hypothetical protein